MYSESTLVPIGTVPALHALTKTVKKHSLAHYGVQRHHLKYLADHDHIRKRGNTLCSLAGSPTCSKYVHLQLHCTYLHLYGSLRYPTPDPRGSWGRGGPRRSVGQLQLHEGREVFVVTDSAASTESH